MKGQLHVDLHAINKRVIIRKLFSILVGNFLCACALILFLKPNQLISGGVGGISIMLEHIFKIPVGIVVFVLNIPLLILGFIYLEKSFVVFSVISTTIFSFYLTVLEVLGNSFVVTNDILLASVFGGIVNGVGLGIMFKNGTCQGGFDILGAVVKRKFNVQIGNVLMAVNAVIITISSRIYSVERALYTLIALFIAYYFLDRIQTGVGKQKQIFIISDKDEEIARLIQRDVHRGVTYLEGMGAYSYTPHKVIYCITNNQQMVQVRELVKRLDPHAFMAVSDTVEISGKGFKKMEI